MVRSVLVCSLLLVVVYVTDGQSTSAARGCVYTFNVPENDCAHTPGATVDEQLLKSSVIALQTQFKLVVNEMRVMGDHIDKLTNDNEKLVNVSNTLASDVKTLQERNDKQDSELRNLKKGRPTSDSGSGSSNQQSPTGGAVYTRWGRKTCPGNGTDLLYWGVAAGSYYEHSGGGSNYLCLHRDPEWGPNKMPGFQSSGYLYGAEYEMSTNDPFSKANTQSLNNNNVPCAVCHVSRRPTKLMIPARQTCPDGWTKEYSGYLMAASYDHKGRTMYVCVDNAPEVIDGGGSNQDGALFYNTEARCGSLPCPKYGDGWEVTCVVCSK